jgi:hypothetical protein
MYAAVPGEASGGLDAALRAVVILFGHPILTESRVTLRALRLLAPLALFASPLSAQYLREVGSAPAPKTLLGINLQLGVPQGEFRHFVETGAGLGGNLTFFLDRGRHAGLRIWGSWIEYGRSTERLPLSPTLPGLNVDLTTSNDIIWILARAPGAPTCTPRSVSRTSRRPPASRAPTTPAPSRAARISMTGPSPGTAVVG